MKKKSSQGCQRMQQTLLWAPNCPIKLFRTNEEYQYEVLHSVWKYLSGILTSIPELWPVKKVKKKKSIKFWAENKKQKPEVGMN